MSEKKPLITIITVNFNTSAFVALMLEALKKLTYYPYEVLICDNGSKPQEILNLVSDSRQHNNVQLHFRIQSKRGSVGHGEALDFLVNKVTTPYFVVFDADATVLHKDWDKMLLELFNDEVKAIGTPYVGDDVFPAPFMAMFETATYKRLGCHFMPVEGEEGNGKDTGYRIKELFFEHQLKALMFKIINTRHEKNGPFGDVLCAEYYLPNKSAHIFCSHFGRGSTDGIAKYKHSWFFKIPYISGVIKRYLGKRDKFKWIDKAKTIITRQTQMA